MWAHQGSPGRTRALCGAGGVCAWPSAVLRIAVAVHTVPVDYRRPYSVRGPGRLCGVSRTWRDWTLDAWSVEHPGRPESGARERRARRVSCAQTPRRYCRVLRSASDRVRVLDRTRVVCRRVGEARKDDIGLWRWLRCAAAAARFETCAGERVSIFEGPWPSAAAMHCSTGTAGDVQGRVAVDEQSTRLMCLCDVCRVRSRRFRSGWGCAAGWRYANADCGARGPKVHYHNYIIKSQVSYRCGGNVFSTV